MIAQKGHSLQAPFTRKTTMPIFSPRILASAHAEPFPSVLGPIFLDRSVFARPVFSERTGSSFKTNFFGELPKKHSVGGSIQSDGLRSYAEKNAFSLLNWAVDFSRGSVAGFWGSIIDRKPTFYLCPISYCWYA